ncbi:unnamed protein product [Leptosia nina]|uniref:Single domain-containing protein n=1 Tax=Leptosia nina TaxID=320188 RepID=A0AAV1JEX2_9NEOP
MLRATVVFFALISVALAATGLMKSDPKPDKYKDVDGCYIRDLDLFIPLGKAVPSKTSCMEYRCSGKLINLFSCGVAHADPPCRVVTKTDVLQYPYPQCCPTIVC